MNLSTKTAEEVVQGNNEFALDVYRHLVSDVKSNLFFSPYRGACQLLQRPRIHEIVHLLQAARIAAEIQALEQGDQVPHFDQIELPAHALGQRFSRAIQEERAREVALEQLGRVYCPDCKKQCRVEIEPRSVTSMDGPIELSEPVAHCRRCRRSFFPSTRRDGVR